MGSLGTFKPECLRGHTRVGNLDKGGHCILCVNYLRRHKKNSIKPACFKPKCTRGHERLNNLTINGHCKTCRSENEKSIKVFERNRISSWKRKGVLNIDGSYFSINDFNRAFQIQGGLCKGCKRHQSEFQKSLSVDHDHKTGNFRGLLCFDCNFLLGLAKDKIEILEALIKYLRGQS